MTTIVVSASTTSTVSTHVPSGTSYLVSAGGTLDVVNGGIISGPVTISVGGIENVSSGGRVLNTSIGGTDFGTGLQFIFSGGTASNTFVLQDAFNDPSFQIVSSGGLAVNTVLSSGKEVVLTGGTASRTSIAGNHGSQSLIQIASGAVVSGGVWATALWRSSARAART
jgi:autotransporter passenger strand-loop-strand repeat protein